MKNAFSIAQPFFHHCFLPHLAVGVWADPSFLGHLGVRRFVTLKKNIRQCQKGPSVSSCLLNFSHSTVSPLKTSQENEQTFVQDASVRSTMTNKSFYHALCFFQKVCTAGNKGVSSKGVQRQHVTHKARSITIHVSKAIQ